MSATAPVYDPTMNLGSFGHSGRGAGFVLGLAVGSVSCGDDIEQAGSGDGSSTGMSAPATDTGEPTPPPTPAESSDGTVEPDTGATTATPAVCGDGMVEGLEDCDDGNRVNGDGCDNDCTETFDNSVWDVVVSGEAGVQEAAQGVAVDTNDDIVVVGYIVDAPSDPDLYVQKLASDGSEIWTTQADPSMGAEDRLFGVAIAGDGTLAVVGEVDDARGASDIYVAQLDADGLELWSLVVDGPMGGNDGGRAVAVDADGNVGVTGFVRVGDGNNDIWVGAYTAAGTPLWSETIDGPEASDDRGRGVAFDDDGALYVGGYVTVGSFNRDAWLRKYDDAGDELWTTTWDSDESQDDAAFSLTQLSNGNVVLAGSTPVTAINEDFWVATFEPEAGELQWWKRFGAPSIRNDNAFGVARDADDNIVVVGFKGLDETDSDIWIKKLDVTGLELWTQTVFGEGMDEDTAHAVAIDSDSNIVVAGEIRNAVGNDGDIWLSKFGPE